MVTMNEALALATKTHQKNFFDRANLTEDSTRYFSILIFWYKKQHVSLSPSSDFYFILAARPPVKTNGPRPLRPFSIMPTWIV